MQPKPYTTPSAAEEALRALGANVEKLWPAKKDGPAPWPNRGLVIAQIDGPWTAPGASPRWAYRHMHCVATCCDSRGAWYVYDHNTDNDDFLAAGDGALSIGGGGWLPGVAWKDRIMKTLIAQTRRATGTFWARASFSVPVRRST